MLRTRLAIPLNVAMQLLEKNNGDVCASEHNFHADNIHEICSVTGCDFETVRDSYNVCKNDKLKAIDKINSAQVIIMTRENPGSENETGFLIWPETKDGESYKTTKRNDAFIPTADFEYIIDEFNSVFPLVNPWNKSIEGNFDVCGHNYFDNITCRLIIEKIERIQTSDPRLIKFIEEVIAWLNDKLDYADYIVIYGNL